MHKGYAGPAGAQIHYRALAPLKAAQNSPLLCLPPSPHSGLYFETVMPLLSAERRVIAMDYPGYGGSDPLAGGATIERFAASLTDFVQTQGPVDLMGFHTGNLVALELALQVPEAIKQTIMVDIPYFDLATRQKYDVIIGQPQPLPKNLGDLDTSFEKNISARLETLGLPRAYDLWVESLRAGAQAHTAFHAAFLYDAEPALKALSSPVTVIATQSSLLEPSRAAAKALPQAKLIEHLDITDAVFEVGAVPISKTILACLEA